MYAAMIAYLDYQIGRIQALLAAKGLWENTLMVFTGDNGGYVEEVAPCNLTSPHGTECFSGEVCICVCVWLDV
jgi:arylsulfatase A-like enzyme